MDENAIRNAIRCFLEQPPAPAVCRASVEQFTWDAVAEQIQQCYGEVLAIYREPHHGIHETATLEIRQGATRLPT